MEIASTPPALNPIPTPKIYRLFPRKRKYSKTAGLCQLSREFQGKPQSGSTGCCTKVHKQGIALGRSVNLSKFNYYEELKGELDQLLEFGGELLAAGSDWLLVYTDDEGDMMLVEDDSWQEFCGMVKKIQR